MRRPLVCLAMCLASWPAAAQTPFFVGDWFGLDQPGIKGVMWVGHWEPGGGFRSEFRNCKRGKASDLRVVGHWTHQHNRVTVQMSSVNGKAFSQTDVYEMLSHDRRGLAYRHTLSGFVFKASRVAADFKMPGCELVS